ncbi:hypothetical protein TNCV_4282981 [Trichonephila clavipes]|nr:hypothetical protein TNCV_4282981 [Trichonephila clavipes]
MDEIGGLGIPLRILWPTLHCRRVAGVSDVPDYCQLTGTLPPLLDSVVGGGTPGRNCSRAYGSNAAVPGVYTPPHYSLVAARVKYLLYVCVPAMKRSSTPELDYSKLTGKPPCNNDALNEMNRLRNLSSE